MHILIADDHGVVRRGLKGILADAFPSTEFTEACTGDEVLSHLGKTKIALLVLDISMPGRSGVDVLRDVKHAYPRLPVIILSGHPEEQYAVRCLRAGASAYIHKESAPEELAIATRKILSGGRYISASLAEKLVDNLDEPGDKPLHELLSDREHDRNRHPTDRNRRCAACQRKDNQHISSTHHGKDADEEQCRTDPLRHDAGIGRVKRLPWQM